MTFAATAESSALRRALGPLAWCALEVLDERAERDGDARVVDASVRSLAVELGVAKNTAHRALVQLARAGLVAPMQRRSAAGRFSAGRYRLHLDHLTPSATTPASPTPRPHRSTRTAPQPSSQLSLLDPS